MRNNAAYLPESPIVYIILPKSIRNRASFQIFVRMKNGKVKRYQQKLSTQLTAGTKTTINLSMDGVLLEEGNTGGFQVDKWKEQNENIHIPLR